MALSCEWTVSEERSRSCRRPDLEGRLESTFWAMRFGIVAANIVYWEGPAAVAAARAAEGCGFDSLWTFEHVIYPDEYASPYPGSPDGRLPMPPSTPIPDPLIWLSYIASATTTLRLATGIGVYMVCKRDQQYVRWQLLFKNWLML